MKEVSALDVIMFIAWCLAAVFTFVDGQFGLFFIGGTLYFAADDISSAIKFNRKDT